MDPLIATLVILILLFVDGLVFGVAASRGVLSIIMIILGLILASFIGLSIPFLSVNYVWTHLTNIITSQANHFQGIFYAFPILWIIGFIVGLLVV